MTTWLNASFEMRFRLIGGQRIKEMSTMRGTSQDTAMQAPKTALLSVTADQAPGCRLHGRRGECEMLDRLVADVRAGRSRVLVLRGEPGAGKTALLEYLAQRAAGCRVARVTGVEPEMEMAFAGLHQLCAPFLDRLGHLPDPQRDALRTAFNMLGGKVPDHFAVAMATLSLLSDLTRERPLVCVVDDAQWLDQASAQALAFVARHLAAGPGRGLLLLEAARHLEPLDAALAREAYREAFGAALTAGRLGVPGEMTQITEAIRASSASRPPRVTDLLDALAAMVTDGHAVAAPMLKRALNAFRDEAVPAQQALGWLRFACLVSREAWDDESWHALSARLIESARQAGALTALPDALQDGMAFRLATGETATATAMAREAETVAEATGNPLRPYGALLAAAWRGQEAEASRLIAAGTTDSAAGGDGQRLTAAAWAIAVLNNGLSRYGEALTAAEQASADPDEPGLATWSLAELIEAAARTGALDRASEALRRLSQATSAAATDWALGIQARSRALLSADEHAERLYREAIERLGRTRMRAELARAHLLYGEWLRRQGRRRDAREQLRTAHRMLDAMRIAGFAERARKELLATGETARKRTIETVDELTAQEAQIARLARSGRSNPEISTQLFISPRTVEWHLRKVFTKLGISSRRELRAALPDLDLISMSA